MSATKAHGKTILYQLSLGKSLILYTKIMFLNWFYLSSACGTILVATVFVANKDIAQTIQQMGEIPGLNERIARMMIGGISVAVGFYVSISSMHTSMG